MRLPFSQQFKKQGDGVLLPFEIMHLRPAECADPSPAAQQARCSEQRGFDRKRIEAGHVPVRINAFDIEMVGLCKHERRIARAVFRVQRQF